MDVKRKLQDLIWLVPALLLILSFVPNLPTYGLLLSIVVCVSAALITYLLFTDKPAYYLIWGIVFIVLFLVYNPIFSIPLSIPFVPLNLVSAIIFLVNWFLIFKSKRSIF